MRFGIWLLCGLIAACPKPLPLQRTPQPTEPSVRLPTFSISTENLLRDLVYLTSPRLEGRGVKTQGINLAAGYIAAQMKEMGLTPGATDGTYFSTVATINLNNDSILVDELGMLYLPDKHFIPLLSSAEGELKAEVVFVGYGRPKDLEGLEVSGKIALLFVTEEELFEKKLAINQLTTYQKMIELGASAILLNAPAGNNDLWSIINDQAAYALTGPLAIYVNSKVVNEWLTPAKEIEPRFTPRRLSKIFTLKISQHPIATNTLQNVVGVLEPSQKSAKTIVIGAHYDHLGVVNRVMYPGADDNASGVVTVLEIARALAAAKPRPTIRVVFCAFTDEEQGLRGSKAYLSSKDRQERIDYMINLDMVGRLRDKVLFIGGYENNWFSQTFIGGYDSKWLSQTLQEVNHEVGLSLTPSTLNPRMGDSDHSSFLSAGITALHFFTGMHEDHHQPTDTLEKLNVEGMAKIVELGVRFVYELGKEEN
jgi:hypothetical protein